MTTERIDVLAVMNLSATDLHGMSPPMQRRAQELREARAAVAELIKAVADRKLAARRLWLAKSEDDKALLSSARSALKAAEDREAAALARVGGTP